MFTRPFCFIGKPAQLIRNVIVLSSSLLLPISSPVYGDTYTLISFDAPHAVDTEPVGINDVGEIAGQFLDQNFSQHGFIRNPAGQFTVFDVPNCDWTSVAGINSRGEITGSCQGPGNQRGFIRDKNGNFTIFEAVPNALETNPVSINDLGGVTGTYSLDGVSVHGFVRSHSGGTKLFDPSSSQGTFPSTINNKGEVVGFFVDPPDYNVPFLRGASGKFTSVAPQIFSLASINEEGETTGEAVGGVAFLQQPSGTLVPFSVPSSLSTFPMTINRDSRIAGHFSIEADYSSELDFGRTGHGFVRDADGAITSFDVPGSLATRPVSINSTGDVAGTWADGVYDEYLQQIGYLHGFLWHSQGISACPTDISLSVNITRSDFHPDYGNRTMGQTLNVTNWGAPLPVGTGIVVDSISQNASLLNPQGFTRCESRNRSPYVVIQKPVPFGASVLVPLVFSDPSLSAVQYTTRVLATNGRK